MAIGAHYDQRVHVPCGAKRAPQQPARVELLTLFGVMHSERAAQLGRTPRSRSWTGARRPQFAPRFAPVVDGYPVTDTLRDQLVRRARLVRVQQQKAGG